MGVTWNWLAGSVIRGT